jgi:hypothetical protein
MGVFLAMMCAKIFYLSALDIGLAVPDILRVEETDRTREKPGGIRFGPTAMGLFNDRRHA